VQAHDLESVVSIKLISAHGHVIITANSAYGKWKIPTTPGRARFFKTLTEARKWAKANPKDGK
jgi:hypothetical protein